MKEKLPAEFEAAESRWPMVSVPRAQQRVVEVLGDLLSETSPYRSAVVLLSYRGADGDPHVAHGSALKNADLACASDFLLLVQHLREVADQLETMIQRGDPGKLTVTPIHWTKGQA